MSDKRYELVYTGKLQPGMDAETVKSNLILSVGIGEDKAARLVENRPKLLKHYATAVEAQVMAEKLERAGIVCVVRDRDGHGGSGKQKSGGESILMSLLKKQAFSAEGESRLMKYPLNGRQRNRGA